MADAYLEGLAKELQRQFADSADGADGGGKRKPSGAFDRILRKFRAQAHSPREQGTLFEKLCLLYFSLDRVHSLRYSKVEPYATWAGKHGLLGQDTGVDLVATLRDAPKGAPQFCAIQCKFYREGTVLNRGDINSFLVKSATAGFAERIIVDTTGEPYKRNMQETIDRQEKPVLRVGLNRLRNSSIEWEYVLAAGVPKQREAKEIRPHQELAIKEALAGFKRADRGKMLMACATGKTFTALKIAEKTAGKGGRILFLAPSLALVSQAIRDWCNDASVPLLCYAVCSDSAVGRTEDDREKSWFGVSDLEIPASTSARALANGIAANKAQHKESMVVVFSTYHSIQRVIDAQNKHKLGEFDLVVCDEAHRTTGVTFEGKDESEFVKVHDAAKLRAKKRLYMTATPRIYGEEAQTRAQEKNAVVCSMDDEAKYGKVFHEISFAKAVEDGLLTDYKVILLQIDKDRVSKDLADYIEKNGLKLDDVALTFGCFRALAKIDIGGQASKKNGKTPNALWRALAFCKNIDLSKNTIRPLFESVAEQAAKMEAFKTIPLPGVVAKHIDGTDGAVKREKELAWLAQGGADGENCHVLCNVRCLSEGVDVPTLDAVLFMHPRRSKVEVVQSVGRVMRRADDKKMGYIILPVVVQPGQSAQDMMTMAQYRLIWQVLNALRSHDERLDGEINAARLGEGVVQQEPRWLEEEGIMVTNVGNRIEVVSVVQKISTSPASPSNRIQDDSDQTPTQGEEGAEEKGEKENAQAQTMRLFNHHLAIVSKIADRCGTRMYWADWATDIARIAQNHILRINAALKKPEIRAEFNAFLMEIRRDINEEVTEEEAVEMLAQHLVTNPVFDALFKPENKTSGFARNNPVSQAMEKVVAKLQPTNIKKETEDLQKFYDSVKRRVQNVKSADAKQKLVKELYDNFFRKAFPRMTEKLGIVYTPVEVVDFIIHSVNDVLRQEFKQTLGGKDVSILDPFTGTGTFIVRLLESGLISPEELKQKYADKIHANEILLLAYYVAAVNIEQAYMGATEEYKPFSGICLTDTFQLSEGKGKFKGFLKDNSRRLEKQRGLPIQVIFGNPPYSAGQRSENDNAQNADYPALDERIAETYARHSKAQNINALYDSYIRAIRWATDRIEDNGIVAFVTNAGWLDGTAHDGMRKCLAKECSSLYIFNLRGNARLQGELWRKEGGKIFGAGSRTPVAINIFVKNPDAKKRGKIYYHDIGDYLTSKEKLAKISAYKSIDGIKWRTIKPNAKQDWINQRDKEFYNHIPLASGTENSFFAISSIGVQTGRDAWAYNSSKDELASNMQRTIKFYNSEARRYAAAFQNSKTAPAIESFLNNDKTKISWTSSLRQSIVALARQGNVKNPAMFEASGLRIGMYRPFSKRWLYFNSLFTHRMGQTFRMFPSAKEANRVISISSSGARTFSALMTDVLPDRHLLESGAACFPMQIYEPQEGGRVLLHESMQQHAKRDGITNWALDAVRRTANNKKISKEDIFYYIYGVLHARDYREKYANNLAREMPRIPLPKNAAQFAAFAKAGKALADLHIGYEKAEEHRLTMPKKPASYRVEKMGWLNNKTELYYNDHIRITDIPKDALQYVVNGRSPVEWVVEQQRVKADTDSNIQNDANHYAATTKDGEKYPLKLIARAITVAIETQKIIAALPPLLK